MMARQYASTESGSSSQRSYWVSMKSALSPKNGVVWYLSRSVWLIARAKSMI
jgi:hypothetical protein